MTAPPSRPVLQVLQPDAGGVPEHALQLALGLHHRGWPVEVAVAPTSGIRERLEQAGVPVRFLPFNGEAGRSRAGYRAALGALRGLDRAHGYSLVHAHSSKAGGVARLALPRSCKVVYTPHCFSFAARWGLPQRAAFWLAEQALVPRTDTIVPVCGWERSLAARGLLGARSRLRLIRSGVPACGGTVEPAPELLDFRGDEPLAGLVARLDEQKDPLTAVRAMRGPAGRHGRLAIVGNGVLRDAVVEEIDRLGLQDRVRWFPFQPPVERWLGALDLFVLSSAWEALPIAILEAMACGLPILSTRVGGVADAVEPGVTGDLVPAHRPDQLGACMARLLSDPARLREMGDAARTVAGERFAIDRMVEETIELYDELLAR